MEDDIVISLDSYRGRAANRPTARRKDALRFFRDEGPLSLARRYGAHWLLVDRARVGRVSFRLPRAYSGSRYVLYRIP